MLQAAHHVPPAEGVRGREQAENDTRDGGMDARLEGGVPEDEADHDVDGHVADAEALGGKDEGDKADGAAQPGEGRGRRCRRRR